MPEVIRLTVAICTRNRFEQLRRTLDALQHVAVPPDVHWDVVVVNNNCTDRTSEVIRSFAGRLPIREALEATPGLSSARNRAIDAATGDYIVYIDDDILVERDWLEEYARAIRTHPTAAVFGGSIRPEFDGEPPTWLVAGLPIIGGVYGLSRDLSDEIALDSPHLPLGGNMVIRTDLLREHRFDSRIGRTAGNLLAGEEAVLLRTILTTGHKGYWVPGARVRHCIPKRMQNVAHVRRYFHDWGVSLATITPPKGRTLLGEPLWMWRQAFQHELLYHVGRIAGKPENWIVNLKWASLAWGGLRGRPARVPRSSD